MIYAIVIDEYLEYQNNTEKNMEKYSNYGSRLFLNFMVLNLKKIIGIYMK